MSLAVQSAGTYGARHPTTQHAVDEWLAALTPLLRLRGSLSIGTDGQLALLNRAPFSTDNPVILDLLRRLHMLRAGELTLMAGFRRADGTRVIEFVAAADPNHLADGDGTMSSWLSRHRVRHVRVKETRLREIKDGDRVVPGGRPRARHQPGKPRKDVKPAELASWRRQFEREAERAGQPRPVPPETRDRIVAHLRGTAPSSAEELGQQLAIAAANTAQLAELLLKVALVQQEVSRRVDEPVGKELVACLRPSFDALLARPEVRTEEGWADLARTLEALENGIVQRLADLTDGGEEDAEIVRAGFRDMQRELEGVALRREYEQKRNALLAVERRVKRFFGSDSADPDDDL